MIKLLNLNAEIEKPRFENRNWWYNPKALAKMAKATSDKYTQQFLIINQFANNPERDRVIYKLFSTESTVSWDEVWFLIRDFSTQYFVSRFEKELQTDERRYIRKYFKYFIVRLQMKMGNYDEATILLNEILQDSDIDVEYEKLFLARVYQAQAECADEREDNTAYNMWMSRMFSEYPQLIPYTGLEMPMRLQVNGAGAELTIERLKNCNIKWVTDTAAPIANITVSKGEKSYNIRYNVQDAKGNMIVPQNITSASFTGKGAASTGVSLAYRLFNIGESPVSK